ncbi:hypothetical protein FQN57_001949 [Myotisia sp. PD_48]|nr:hypothetical protein FQN57_001949 [Myotisia sp. PD_48]
MPDPETSMNTNNVQDEDLATQWQEREAAIERREQRLQEEAARQATLGRSFPFTILRSTCRTLPHLSRPKSSRKGAIRAAESCTIRPGNGRRVKVSHKELAKDAIEHKLITPSRYYPLDNYGKFRMEDRMEIPVKKLV